jgi:hypothetical protein
MKKGSATKSIVSADPFHSGDWTFKISEVEGIIMVVAYHELVHWTGVRFFTSEVMAKNFVEFLELQTDKLDEK